MELQAGVPHTRQEGFKASMQIQYLIINESHFIIYLHQREGKSGARSLGRDSSTERGQSPEQGQRGLGVHLSPPQAFRVLLSRVTSTRTERPAVTPLAWLLLSEYGNPLEAGAPPLRNCPTIPGDVHHGMNWGLPPSVPSLDAATLPLLSLQAPGFLAHELTSPPWVICTPVTANSPSPISACGWQAGLGGGEGQGLN